MTITPDPKPNGADVSGEVRLRSSVLLLHGAALVVAAAVSQAQLKFIACSLGPARCTSVAKSGCTTVTQDICL
jgi:hypothetical protein